MKTSTHETPDTATFILLDGALINGMRTAYTHDDSPWADLLYRGTRHENALAVSPCLIKPSEESRLWQHVKTWGAYGIGLRAACSPTALADHLRSLISVRLPTGQLSYCRFYSNKQLPRLMESFSEQEARDFSGPVSGWFSTHPSSPFSDVALNTTSSLKTPEDEGWFQLTSEHMEVLNRRQQEEFCRKLCRHLSVPADESSLGAVRELHQKAKTFGFASESEVATFVELMWNREENLQSPACMQLLNDPHKSVRQKLNALDNHIAYGGA